MLPFTNSINSFSPFEQFTTQICPPFDLSNVYMPLSSYGYYFHQSPFLMQNVPIDHYPLITIQPKINSESFASPSLEKLPEIQTSKTNKNDSLETIDEKISYEEKKIPKNKPISKKRSQKINEEAFNTIKVKKTSNQSKYNEEEYSLEEENKKKSEEQLHLYLKYRRKNTESNIVNRIYSFLTSEIKNKHELLRLGLTEEKKHSFLKYLNQVVEAWRGPVKRQLLRSLMNANDSLPGFKSLIKTYEVEKILSLEEFSYLTRILIKAYLSKIAGVSVITSKKMKKSVWKEHLEKIRELRDYFFEEEESCLKVEGAS